MSKIAVVYWSGTGNTEMMALKVAEGAKAAGAEAALFNAAEFSPAAMDQFDAIAFGCPSMGAEQLEETTFAPMEETCSAAGAVFACDSVICNEAPDAEADAACLSLGKALS